MVRMTKPRRGTYPRLAQFVSTALPTLRTARAPIWNAFLAHSRLSGAQVTSALAWGAGPQLEPIDLGRSNGYFDAALPQVINLSSDVAARFELDADLPQAQILIESTILHEMIHWAYSERGVPEPNSPEVGAEFERAAYGGDVDRYWAVTASAVEKPRPQLLSLTKSMPRGIRNNNPGNIRIGEKWQGLAAVEDMTPFQRKENAFCVFSAPRWGIRAMARILITYQDRYNFRTVGEMIGRWAPPNENDTATYARAVARAVGVKPTDPINITQYHFAFPMIAAMIRHENAEQPYTHEQIDSGLVLAGIETPMMAVS